MNRRLSILPFALAALVGAGSVAHAQIFGPSLTDEERGSLSPAALTSYQQALHYFDRVNTPAAIEELANAAAIDTSNIPLQFLVVTYARQRAETTYAEESLRYFDKAEAALRRLLANPDLEPGERNRVSRESERVREGKEGIRQRDEARLNSGMEVMRNVRAERLVRTGIAQRARDIMSVDQALRVEDPVEDEGMTVADVWPIFAAPGLALDLEPPRVQPGQWGGMGGDPWGWGMDPSMMYGDPGMMGGGQPAWGGQPGGGFGQPQQGGDPFGGGFGQPQQGGDPFGDPFGGGGGGFGQPQPGGDPFGQPQQGGGGPFFDEGAMR